MGKQKAKYSKIFIKNLGICLVVYLVAMGIFTGVRANNYIKQEDDLTTRTREKLSEKIQSYEAIDFSNESNLSVEQIEMWKKGRIAYTALAYWTVAAPGVHKDTEGQLAIYDVKNKEWVGRGGNSLLFKTEQPLKVSQQLASQYADQNQGELFEIYSPLYLEHYLNKEQSDAVATDGVVSYGKDTFRVEGYYNDGEIIPTKLEQYVVKRDEADTRKIVSQELVNTYTFDVSVDTNNMTPFVGSSKHLYLEMDARDIYEGYSNIEGGWNWASYAEGGWSWSAYNSAIRPDIDMLIQNGDTGRIGKKNIFKVDMSELTPVQTNNGEYWISNKFVYFPMYDTLFMFWKVYILALVIMVAAAGILSLVKWKMQCKKYEAHIAMANR